jgi:hypothetical protein
MSDYQQDQLEYLNNGLRRTNSSGSQPRRNPSRTQAHKREQTSSNSLVRDEESSNSQAADAMEYTPSLPSYSETPHNGRESFLAKRASQNSANELNFDLMEITRGGHQSGCFDNLMEPQMQTSQT